MRQHRYWVAVIAVAVLAAVPMAAADEVTLEGGYVWERDDGNREGDLKATLTPAGDGKWTVAFHFDWDDGPHVYKGECSGSLEGEFSGDIISDGEREMKFKFSGAFERGVFNGVHNFVGEDGELKRAGTLTLKVPS